MMNQGQSVTDRYLALEPERSVVVEACAGSGKTWLLTARILRILLQGVRPGEILAITYTRKAAREIESRLRSLLADLAILPDEKVISILEQRGLGREEAAAHLPKARTLFELVAYARPGITVTTFHGWFARLLAGAPLDSGLSGRALDEASTRLLDEAWVQLSTDCTRDPEGAVASSLLFLYAEIGAYMAYRLMSAFIERRAEWRVWIQVLGGKNRLDGWLEETFHTSENPLERLFSDNRIEDLQAFVTMLKGAGSRAESMAANLMGVLAEEDVDERFRLLSDALLTKSGDPRALSPVKAYQAAHGEAGVEALKRLFAELSMAVTDAHAARQDQINARFNHHALIVGSALLEKLDAIKQQRRVMDFSDLEVEVDKLLDTEGTGAYLQARLDARYRQILLDEFQDTNPLQWRILRGWLDAYEGTGLEHPRVFLVGDPKQSIYRFRRAEPGLFGAAADYLSDRFHAIRVQTAHTFRNAGGINALVNEVFREEPLFQGFTEQTSERAGWEARIEVLPLIDAEDESSRELDPDVMRNPLKTARQEVEDLRRTREAESLARRIGEIAGHWMIRDKSGGQRLARYSDILILTRRKTYLALYEAALRNAGIPYLSPGRGGLLDTLEAQDLMAVLRFLACPTDDLALAHALCTPALGLDHECLLNLPVGDRQSWWECLQDMSVPSESPVLARAVSLLQGWIQAATTLPAHDLLDRILHESSWFARTRAAVPAEAWPGICANLEAMLELALGVDGGRYPSLTRFVDELRRLSSSDDEAPDEGLIASSDGTSGRVRIMTIHGSKGLEAPIVWMIDTHVANRGQEGYCVAMDWQPGALKPRHFSLLGRLGEAGRARASIIEQEDLAAEREDLNLLYVAITRAEQVLIISGVTGRSDPENSHYRRIARAVSRMSPDTSMVGELPACADMHAGGHPVVGEMAVFRPTRTVSLGQLRQHAEEITSEASREALAFGTAMHGWLEAQMTGRPLPNVAPEIERAARKLLDRPSLRRFFDPALYRKAGNESSFVTPDGSIGRIDRWVDAEDAVWVLDYKSGHPAKSALMQTYHDQLSVYRDVLRTIFPGREVKAMLVFSEGGEILVE